MLYKIRWMFLNIYYYRQFLWTNRDYDVHWLLNINLLWMKQFEKHTKECSHGRPNKQMAEASELLEKIIKDDWIVEEEILHDKKWGKARIVYGKLTKNKMARNVTIKRSKVITDENKKQELKEKKVLWDLESQRRKVATNRYFYLYKKYYQSWWC